MENEISEEQFEIKTKQVVITSKFNCQSFPLGRYEKTTVINEEGIEETKEIFIPLPHLIEITEEELAQIGKTKCFDIENNRVVDYDNTIDKIIERKNELRAKRVTLLKAFDVYKSSVAYGTEIETEEQRVKMMTWYNLLLALDKDAMKKENIPERVKYYL